MQALAFPYESPICPFGEGAMSESGVPRQRNRDRPTIDEFDHQRIFCERYALRPRLADVNR